MSESRQMLQRDAEQSERDAIAHRPLLERVDKGPSSPALGLVKDAPAGQQWVYQGGVTYQVGPHDAVLAVNMRVCTSPIIDLEAGCELHLIDTLKPFTSKQRLRLAEVEEMIHPRTGERVHMSPGFAEGGFIPLGALGEDGQPHPHAGTGFIFISYTGFPAALAEKADTHLDGKSDIHTFVRVYQLVFDGRQLSVTGQQEMRDDQLIEGIRCMNLSFIPAIPDGNDLLMGVAAGSYAGMQGGFSRWSRVAGRWQPTAYVLVDEHGCEPTLARDLADGSLLLCTRPSLTGSPFPLSPRIHRSVDGGRSWSLVFQKAILTGNTPVMLNRAMDGSLYLATNQHHLPRVHPLAKRNIIVFYPLSPGRDEVLEAVVFRDGPLEFGPPSRPQTTWRLDHPMGGCVRLADGRWRHLVVHRLLDELEMRTNAGPTDRTGCYIEEVASAGDVVPPWRFE